MSRTQRGRGNRRMARWMGLAVALAGCQASLEASATATSHAGEGATALSPMAVDAAANTPRPDEDIPRFAVPEGDAAATGAVAPLVTIVQFSDFECPFCGRVAPTLDRLLERFPGELRLVFRHHPLPFHRHAATAAMAAEEVRRQAGDEAFWRYHRVLFANQRALDPEDLVRYAAEVPDVVPEEVERAIEEQRHADRIDADVAAAERFAAVGTPYHFINGRPLAGAQPIEAFDEIIREEIALAAGLLRDGVRRARVVATIMDGAATEREEPPRPTAARVPAPLGLEGRVPAQDDETVYAVPVTGEEPSRGPADALVTIVEFSDFECPFCGRVQPTLERLLTTYAGDVRLVWKNSPLPFHRGAMPTALAAHEVFRQSGSDGFWAFHDLAFANQRDLERANHERWASTIPGVSIAAFGQALDDGRHRALVAEQMRLARSVGARGTPTFFINGRRVRGAQPYDVFARVVEQELARARTLVADGTPRTGVYAAAIAEGVTTAAPPDPAPPPDPARFDLPVPPDAPALGPADAALTIQMFTDFQCPFCRRVQPAVRELREDYPDVRIVFRHYPLPMHRQAWGAHRAAWEVLAQGGTGAFWRFHDLLFQNQRALGRRDLEGYAAQIGGIDATRFREAVDTDVHDSRIQGDIDAVADAGMRIGTPSFLIGTRLLVGAQPVATFRAAIDAEMGR